MPDVVANTDSWWAGAEWRDWPVPTMPDLTPDQVPWSGQDVPWRRPIASWPQDPVRTELLRRYDVKIVASAGNPPWKGTSYGMPYQIVTAKGPLTPVWNLLGAPVWSWSWAQGLVRSSDPIDRLPLPSVVRREGDPGCGPESDAHWYGVDPTERRLYEAISLSKSPLNRLKTWGTTDWCSAGVAAWDTSRTWNAASQPLGVVAAKVPQFPLVPRWDEIKRGRIDHAIFGVLPDYAPQVTGWARGSDGTSPGHPVRAGEPLRLRRSVVDVHPAGSPERIICEALWQYGWVQCDRNNATTGGIALTQDRRWYTGEGSIPRLGELRVRLSDFEVVTQP